MVIVRSVFVIVVAVAHGLSSDLEASPNLYDAPEF